MLQPWCTRTLSAEPAQCGCPALAVIQGLHKASLAAVRSLVAAVLQELEKHTAAFVGQARVLATWDSAVLSNRHALLDLEAELRAVHAGQEALDRQLGMIETHQKVRRVLPQQQLLLLLG